MAAWAVGQDTSGRMSLWPKAVTLPGRPLMSNTAREAIDGMRLGGRGKWHTRGKDVHTGGDQWALRAAGVGGAWIEGVGAGLT